VGESFRCLKKEGKVKRREEMGENRRERTRGLYIGLDETL